MDIGGLLYLYSCNSSQWQVISKGSFLKFWYKQCARVKFKTKIVFLCGQEKERQRVWSIKRSRFPRWYELTYTSRCQLWFRCRYYGRDTTVRPVEAGAWRLRRGSFYTVEPRYNEGPTTQGTGEICSLWRGFVISKFFSICVNITGVKKTTAFVIPRTWLHGGSIVSRTWLYRSFCREDLVM